MREENANVFSVLGKLFPKCQQLDMSRDLQLFLGKRTFYFRIRTITLESRRLETRLNDFARDL